MSATPSTCEACGASFGCGAGTGSCWCAGQDVPRDVLEALRTRFAACLCPACLTAAAVGGELLDRAERDQQRLGERRRSP